MEEMCLVNTAVALYRQGPHLLTILTFFSLHCTVLHWSEPRVMIWQHFSSTSLHHTLLRCKHFMGISVCSYHASGKKNPQLLVSFHCTILHSLLVSYSEMSRSICGMVHTEILYRSSQTIVKSLWKFGHNQRVMIWWHYKNIEYWIGEECTFLSDI